MKLFCILLLLGLSGCAAQSPRGEFRYVNTGDNMVVWPSRPDIPRYRYVGELTGQSNFVSRQNDSGFLSRLVGLIAGAPRPKFLLRPHNGYTSRSGVTYVADTSRQAVFVFDPEAGNIKLWEFADTDTHFSSPVAITETADGVILVSDADLGYISRFSADGQLLGTFGSNELERPTGIAVDNINGNIYVSDTSRHDIKVFTSSGILHTTIGRRGDTNGTFNYPTYLHIAAKRLLVTDAMNARVQVLDLDGKHIMSIGSRGSQVGNTPRPKGVTTDTDGNIYVIESYYDHMLVYNRQGQFLLPVGGTGASIGEFYLPAGIWADATDRIYIADMFNGRIVVMQYLGGD